MAEFFNLPEFAEIEGRKYALNTDFSVWLTAGEILSSSMPPQRAIPKLINLCFKDKPQSLSGAARAIGDFYKGAFPPYRGEGKGGASFSAKHDRCAIFSGFMKCYGIDLICESLHWYKFLPLLLELSDCLFSKIMLCRASDNPKLRDMFSFTDKNSDSEFAEQLFDCFLEV